MNKVAPMNFLTPVGRFVGGSAYTPITTDMNGNPKTFKSGDPRVEYKISLAVRKGTETHWSQTEWGAVIHGLGSQAFPATVQSPFFAWKIVDGDGQTPNSKGVKPADREGYAGCWVLHLAGSYAPKLWNEDGTKQLLDENAVMPGDYIQVYGEVVSNKSDLKPGVYLNPIHVSFQRWGEKIITKASIDVASIGFGKSPIPEGASSVPLSGGFNPGTVAVPNGVASVMRPATTPIPAPVTPHHGILTPPPVPTNATLVAPVRVMLPAANGLTYDDYIAAGWTEQQLIQHGLLQQT